MGQSFKNKTLYTATKQYGRSMIWFIALLPGWLFLWFAPWQVWLTANLWLKAGIATIIFIVPGTFIYRLMHRGIDSRTRSIPFGIALSHLLITLLGTTGRLFHFSFLYVKNIFMALGMVFIILNLLMLLKNPKQHGARREYTTQLVSYWPLAIIASLTALMTIQRVISSDDLAYLAHITNWQHLPALNFTDVYFDTDKVESSRFWIAGTPFFQAFLSEVSGIPGLILLSGYLEPYLALIAVVCYYELARTLKLSQRSAMLAVAVQFTFLALLSGYLHPGAPFFHQLSTDKATAAFIVAPGFIISAICLLQDIKQESFIVFLLISLSLSFMHPVISAYASFLVCAIALLGTRRNNYKKHAILIMLVIVALSPQIVIRFIGHEAQSTIPYSVNIIEQTKGMENLISRWGQTKFYGFNPSILAMHIPYSDRVPIPTQLTSWIWIVIPTLAMWATTRSEKNNPLKNYILAASLLVALAGIPFTGWILGYFVSAWMLERTTWLYPFGLSTMFVILIVRDHSKPGQYFNSQSLTVLNKLKIEFAWLGQMAVWVISLLLILLFMREQNLPNIARLQSSTQRYQELSLIGQYIDENTPHPVNTIGSDELNDFLPALSWKAKVISYRPEDTAYPYFYTEEEKVERLSGRQALLNPNITPDKKLEILQKYNIKYVLIESYRYGKVKDLISEYPLDFTTHSFGRYSLIEFISAKDSTDL